MSSKELDSPPGSEMWSQEKESPGEKKSAPEKQTQPQDGLVSVKCLSRSSQ